MRTASSHAAQATALPTKTLQSNALQAGGGATQTLTVARAQPFSRPLVTLSVPHLLHTRLVFWPAQLGSACMLPLRLACSHILLKARLDARGSQSCIALQMSAWNATC